MRIAVKRSPRELGEEAACMTAQALKRAISERGVARLALGTGASQLEALSALARQDVPWKQVELFQIGERFAEGGSCLKALRDRLIRRVPVGRVYGLDGTEESLRAASEALKEAPIDAVLLGMGDQGQIGFNAAPADFENCEPYAASGPDGPTDRVIAMTVQQMLRSRRIILCAPYALHAETVWRMLTRDMTPDMPATAFKRHPDFDLLLDTDSAAQINVELAAAYNPQLEAFSLPADERRPDERNE